MPTLTPAEVANEIKGLCDQADLIEKKYPEGDITNNEDLAEYKRILTDVDEKKALFERLEDQDALRTKRMGLSERFGKPYRPVIDRYGEELTEARTVSPGQQFTKSREYRELKNSGAFNSPLNRIQLDVQLAEGTSLLEWKTVLFGSSDSSGGAFVINDHRPGFVNNVPQRDITLLPMIPRLQTDSDTVEYVRQDTFTNAAATVAEATGSAQTGTDGRKPESAIAFSTQTSAVRTLAHWIPVTNRMLADAAQIRGIIDSQLLLGLELLLENQVVSGGGTGEDLLGMLNVTGIGVVGKGTDSDQDALFKGRTLVKTAGKGMPTAIVLNPTDFQTIRLTRESAATATPGGYLMGLPSIVGATTLWGLPVIESEALPQGTGLVADFTQSMAVFDREQSAVRVGTINDQFIRNQQTILAEMRLAFAVWRPKLLVKVTGL